jgi:outer membrane protein OmpA-like peptidoglycan-associated protein
VRRVHFLVAVVAAAGVAACGQRRVNDPSAPGAATIVLLPDEGADGRAGRATVSTSAGAVQLNAPRDASTVVAGRPPAAVRTMSERDIQRMFGDALDALPPPATRFTLNFLFESDALTPESEARLREVLSAIDERAFPDVLIVGHTDSSGAPAANDALGLKRAETIRARLLAAGLDRALVDVASHGERELLVPTPDDTPEPANRRVDITIR